MVGCFNCGQSLLVEKEKLILNNCPKCKTKGAMFTMTGDSRLTINGVAYKSAPEGYKPENSEGANEC